MRTNYQGNIKLNIIKNNTTNYNKLGTKTNEKYYFINIQYKKVKDK